MSKKKAYSPVKPARSYAEQARRLTDAHNLVVRDEKQAQHIFSTVNYYRLTTYGKHLRRPDDPERFIDGVTLDTLYALYRFDMGLRHQLWPVLEFFEVQLRAKISYQLAIAYGSLGYLNADNFRPDRQSQGWHRDLQNKFRTEVRRQNDLSFVRHHKTKYGGKFPIWAAMELYSFGMTAQLYKIMREEDQRAVSRDYALAPEALTALIDSAIDVRNICAHYGRLYNQVLEDQPHLRDEDCLYASEKLFPVVLGLKAVAGREPIWREMLEGLARLCLQYPEADLGLCGFPPDWMEILS